MALVLVSAVICWAAAAFALTSFPNKAIKIIVPFAAGGSVDIVPRMIAERMSAILGQPVVVENQPGAGGNIGAEVVFKADADGYTLLASPMPLLTINRHLYKNLRFDPIEFASITLLTRYPTVFLARASLKAANLSELIAYAKQNPGKLSYASQGVGTIGHVAFEKFRDTVGIDAVHIPYKGNAPALNDLMGGQVDVLVSDLVAAMPSIDTGLVKVLAVGGERRLEAFPSTPTIAETVSGFVLNSWMGLVAPPGTPDAVITTLADATREAVNDRSVKTRLEQLYSEAAGDGPKVMRSVMVHDSEMWADVIRRAKITLGN